MKGGHLGGTLTAHARTWRPYTLWYVGLVGLAGQTLATGQHAISRLAAAWAVPTLIWVAAHYLGDFLDRDLDAISKPQRPIPAGLIRPATALICGAILAAGACAVGLVVNWRTVFVLIGGIVGAVAYSAFFKARGLWGNLVRGGLTSAAFVFGEMMATTHPLLSLLPFPLVFWAHDTASNLVGTMRDITGDREGGYITFAVRHGIRTTAWTAVGLYALAVSAAIAGLLIVPRARTACLVMLLIAAFVGLYAFRMVLVSGRTLTVRIALRAHEVLVAERLVLASALLAPGLGVPMAVGILALVLAVTLATQRTMRSRHEFPPDVSERLATAGTAPSFRYPAQNQ